MGRWFNIDPLAFDYHDNSPYHYSGNNPILFMDVDGRYYVDADGNRIETNLDDNGMIQLGDNATDDLRELVNAVNSSGSSTAIEQILEAGQNETMIHVRIETEEVNNGLLGVHQAHDKDGNILEWDSNKGDFNGVPAYVEGKEGVYKEATITVFKGNIESTCGGSGCGNAKFYGIRLSSEQSVATTFGHEANHDTDKEFIQDLRNKRENKPHKNVGAHDNIDPKEARVWNEIQTSNISKRRTERRNRRKGVGN